MSPPYETCASASQWVAAWRPITTMSSLTQKLSASLPYWSLMAIIVRSGLTRPGMLPICGLCWSSRTATENGRPVRTLAAPRRTASPSIRLSVPISSPAPHRPQLLTFAASAVNQSGSGTLPIAGRGVHRVLVELGDDLLAEQLHRLDHRLGGQRVGRRAERELVDADVGPALDGARAVVRITDDRVAVEGRLLDLLRRRLGQQLRPLREPVRRRDVVEPVVHEARVVVHAHVRRDAER